MWYTLFVKHIIKMELIFMKLRAQPTSNCDIDPIFYPQIMEGLNQAIKGRENGIKGYTVEEVIANMDRVIKEAEKNVPHHH